MSWPEEYTFEAADFFTLEAQEIGRLVLEHEGRRWVLLAMRAESTGGRWAATWCGLEGDDAHRLPRVELGPALVELLRGGAAGRRGAGVSRARRLAEAVERAAVLEGERRIAEVERERDEARARVDELEALASGLLLGSLLEVRRAAFAPTIGVRYTETIRAGIAEACRRLEDACRSVLAARADAPTYSETVRAGIADAWVRGAEKVTHGRHCPCSACAQEDWTRPDLAPCGMHGYKCPRVYAPLKRELETAPECNRLAAGRPNGPGCGCRPGVCTLEPAAVVRCSECGRDLHGYRGPRCRYCDGTAE